MPIANKRVLVAMSGGVDSSVAAYLLKKEGHDVIGVSMRLYGYDENAKHGCCTPDDLKDAKRVADQIGILHYVVDMQVDFEKKVIEPFVQSYQIGETPNPCVRCNQDIKFSLLLDKAKTLGASLLATGHYARIEKKQGVFELHKAKDRSKDQSYFLYGLSQKELSMLCFPLGDLNKTEVRQLAKEADLNVHNKKDSYEICFVPNDYVTFLEKKLSPSQYKKGRILNHQGQVLDHHDGIHRFTVGQRKGLKFSKQLPMFVSSIKANGDVLVCNDEALFQKQFSVHEVKWTHESLKPSAEVDVKIRSRFEPQKARVVHVDAQQVGFEFLEAQRAITPGQAAVFYNGDLVLGGGWIA